MSKIVKHLQAFTENQAAPPVRVAANLLQRLSLRISLSYGVYKPGWARAPKDLPVVGVDGVWFHAKCCTRLLSVLRSPLA